ISTARHPESTVSVIATVDGPGLNHLATDVVALLPLTLTETSGYLQSVTGRNVPVGLVEQIHAETGGWPGAIDALLTSLPEGELVRGGVGKQDPAAHLARARALTAAFELPTAELHL